MGLREEIRRDLPWTYLPLGDRAGTVAYNRTPNASPTHATHSPPVVTGAPGLGPDEFSTLYSDTAGFTVNGAVFNFAQFTLEGWVYPLSYVSTHRGMVIGCVDGNGASTIDKVLSVGTAGNPGLYAYDTGTRAIFGGNGDVPLRKWTHLVAVGGGGGNARIYVNGVVRATGTINATFTGYTVPNVHVNGVGSGDPSIGTFGYWNARRAHCAIYPSILPQERVVAHYRAGLALLRDARRRGRLR